MAEEVKKEKLEEKKTVEESKGSEVKTAEAPKENSENKEEKTEDKKTEGKSDTKTADKKAETKPVEKQKKVPKSEAFVYSPNAHLSMKTCAAIGRFIVGKTIDQATEDLKEVAAGKKPVPMKGEIPHRHGDIMSGRFPKNASEHFIMLLKTLAGNCSVNGLEEPVIAEAIANIGKRPYGKFGSVRRKRAHIKIIAKNRKDWQKSRSKKAKMNKVKKSNKKQNKEKKE